MALNLIACNSTPSVNNSWVKQNCKSLSAFTPDNKPRLTYCKSFDGVTQTCKRKKEIYKGTFFNGRKHGQGELTVQNTYYKYKGVFKNDKKWCGIEQLENGYNRWANGQPKYHDQQIDWEAIAVGALIVGVAVAAAQSSGGGSSSSSNANGYAWDGFYRRGTFVYQCRSFNGQFAPNAKHIAHFDIDSSEIGKVKTVDWHHIGILRRDLDTLCAFGTSGKVTLDITEWHKEIAELKTVHALNFDRDSDRIQPYAVLEEINKLTAGNALISTGVGQHQMWAAQYFDFKEPRLWLTSGSMGTMGFGLPAAIGAQFAKPGQLIIDVDGDSSIRMNIGELETATTYGLPIKVLVLNNYGDGMVKQWQKLYYKGRFSASDKSLHRKDFVKTAQADGFEFAKRLDKKADITSLVKEFIEFPGPAFLEVIIDRDAMVYPMIGPGVSYSQMITGEHIQRRDIAEPTADPDSSSLF